MDTVSLSYSSERSLCLSMVSISYCRSYYQSYKLLLIRVFMANRVKLILNSNISQMSATDLARKIYPIILCRKVVGMIKLYPRSRAS